MCRGMLKRVHGEQTVMLSWEREVVYASLRSGTLAGDFGFDPLGMMDPEGQGGFVNARWLAYAEVRASPDIGGQGDSLMPPYTRGSVHLSRG